MHDMRENCEHRFGEVTVRFEQPYIITIFPEGRVVAAPISSEEDVARSKSLGYSSPHQMFLEHDLTHSWLAHKLGEPYSRNLKNLVTPLGLTEEEIAEEESLVFAFNRYVNDGTYCDHLQLLEPKLEAFKAEFVQTFRAAQVDLKQSE